MATKLSRSRWEVITENKDGSIYAIKRGYPWNTQRFCGAIAQSIIKSQRKKGGFKLVYTPPVVTT